MKYRKLHGYKYQLVEKFYYSVGIEDIKGNEFASIAGHWLTIEKNYMWDGPSGPTIDTLNFMKASLVHDALYQLMREGHLDKKYKKQADKLLRGICLQSGMSKFRAWYVYMAVKFFGSGYKKTNKDNRGEIIEL